MTNGIRRETATWQVLLAYLVKEPACRNEHLARLTAAGAIQALDDAGCTIVRKPASSPASTDGGRAGSND